MLQQKDQWTLNEKADRNLQLKPIDRTYSTGWDISHKVLVKKRCNEILELGIPTDTPNYILTLDQQHKSPFQPPPLSNQAYLNSQLSLKTMSNQPIPLPFYQFHHERPHRIPPFFFHVTEFPRNVQSLQSSGLKCLSISHYIIIFITQRLIANARIYLDGNPQLRIVTGEGRRRAAPSAQARTVASPPAHHHLWGPPSSGPRL